MSVTVLDIQGKTITKITKDTASDGNDRLVFVTECGKQYEMTHWQDCCESVNLEEVIGDLDDLLHTPLLMAEETANDPTSGEYGEDEQWTFYKFGTVKGYVTLRWYGTSNGYYSTSVNFAEIGSH